MNVLLRHVLDSLVRQGSLRVTGPNGRVDQFGDGTGAPAHIHIKTSRAELAITFDPMLALPEAYMSGEVDLPEGGVLGLMRIVFENIGAASIDTAWTKALDRVRHAFRRFQQINTAQRARRNVEVHYDLSIDLYRLFLDTDMQYSCAYFQRPEMTPRKHSRPSNATLPPSCFWSPISSYLMSDAAGADLASISPGRSGLMCWA